MTDDGTVLNIDAIKRLIPHRAPMLLIDRVENIIADSEATGIKAVSGNEPYFIGHFPGLWLKVSGTVTHHFFW